MPDPPAPYRTPPDDASLAPRGVSGIIPRPITRAEVLFWRVVGYGPPFLGIWFALGTAAGCNPFGGATPTIVALGIGWGIAAYAAAWWVRAWARRQWASANEALRSGDVNLADAQFRNIHGVARMAPDFVMVAHAGLGQVALRRGDLPGARAAIEAALASPWLAPATKVPLHYTMATVHALAGRAAEGRNLVATADALAPRRMSVWSSVSGAHLSIAAGDFADAAAKLEVASRDKEGLQTVSAAKLVEALWAYCLQRTGAGDEAVRAHLGAASPLSRKQIGHYLAAWPDFADFLAAHGVTLEA